LASHYRRRAGELQGRGAAFPGVPGLKSKSVFEAVFWDWLVETRPPILERWPDLMMGLGLLSFDEPKARARVSAFFRDLRALSQVSEKLAAQLKALPEWARPALPPLAEPLDAVLKALAPLAETFKTKGRRAEPFRLMAVRCLREAGLTVPEVARMLEVSKDAVRKLSQREAEFSKRSIAAATATIARLH
jgi:hypothetical protein